jgi:copper chaperone NosL
MKQKARILMALAAILLAGSYLFPIWTISLQAPQFPEPLTMEIWLNKIAGDQEHVLQNINILNHYIGMAPIESDSFPELVYMPFIVLGLIVTGLAVAWKGNRNLAFSWVILIALLGMVGLYDFYMWEYEFGHNLDPKAAIKIEGMAYQPPLIGEKMLLNFKAVSLPYAGTYFIIAGTLSAILAIFLSGAHPHKPEFTDESEYEDVGALNLSAER